MSLERSSDAPTQVPDASDPGEWLHQLEAFSDASLAHLSLERLLDELLDRAHEFLRADTAAVLMLDPGSQHLEATAARGIEEEVRQGVRLPLGRGFAGRIAATKSAVAIDRVDHTTVLNPLLMAKGIRSMLGVPLLAAGNVLGVLHVGTLDPRVFTDQDARLLQAIADRVSLALQARISEGERTAARVLQRSLLPGGLPVLPDVELATRYVPGNNGEIGGDWYDVFALPSGALCLVVGDVVGHGPDAAHAMGRIRTALRAYALETERPAEILTKLDRQISYFNPGLLATVLCGVLEPGHDRLHLSNAGHPPPILAAPLQARAVALELPADPPVGLPPSLAETLGPRRTTSIDVPVGAALCCYTDGLVERRGENLDEGIGRLADLVMPTRAETVCAKVMAEFVGVNTREDDVAVLVLHRTSPPALGELGALGELAQGHPPH